MPVPVVTLSQIETIRLCVRRCRPRVQLGGQSTAHASPNGESGGRRRSSRRTHRGQVPPRSAGTRLVQDGFDDIRSAGLNSRSTGSIVDHSASLISKRNAMIVLRKLTGPFFRTATTIVLVASVSTPPVFACDPLLVLFEGAGWSSGSRGDSIRSLAAELKDQYLKNGDGIEVVSVDHRLFMDSFGYFNKRYERAANAISESNFWPIVIIGHSLGAQTAYDVASRIEVSLLITFDGVSFWGRDENLPHPGEKWININASGDGWGPDWGYQGNPDKQIKVDLGHSDVTEMFGHVRNIVENTLRNCDHLPRSESIEGKLCDIPGANCSVTWKLTDGCPEGDIIEVRFFEYDENSDLKASWRRKKIKGNGTSSFKLRCYSPGHRVCYGAANRPGYHWGVGMDGRESCTDCCASCGTGFIYNSGSLTC